MPQWDLWILRTLPQEFTQDNCSGLVFTYRTLPEDYVQELCRKLAYCAHRTPGIVQETAIVQYTTLTVHVQELCRILHKLATVLLRNLFNFMDDA